MGDTPSPAAPDPREPQSAVPDPRAPHQAAPGPAGPDAAAPTFGQSRYQLDPDDTPTLPRLFAQGDLPPGFWDQPAAPPDGQAVPAQFGVQIASTLPPRAERRRGALMAIGLVAVATIVVVAAALLIGPHLGGPDADADQRAVPPNTPASSGVDPTTTSSSSAPSTAALSPAGAGTGTAGTAPTSVVTVTVTAGSTAGGQATRSTSASTSATSRMSTAPGPYGVPIRQIACTDGYIVQLASELTPKAFTARIATLRQQGLVPANAKAADSTKSCKLFTNQSNTLILYAGPFKHRYDACGDRLAGPYDAFIRGATPGTAAEFVSCICPAQARSLPRVSKVGDTSQWIGELQRMLAAHLRYRIDDLGVGTWGVYTAGTRSAVKRFQSDNHLRPSGTVDAATWAALQHAGC